MGTLIGADIDQACFEDTDDLATHHHRNFVFIAARHEHLIPDGHRAVLWRQQLGQLVDWHELVSFPVDAMHCGRSKELGKDTIGLAAGRSLEEGNSVAGWG